MNATRVFRNLEVLEAQSRIAERTAPYKDSFEKIVDCIRAESSNPETRVLLSGESVACMLLEVPFTDVSLIIDSTDLCAVAKVLERHFDSVKLQNEEISIELDGEFSVKVRVGSDFENAFSIQRLYACPLSGKLQVDSGDFGDLCSGVLRITEAAFEIDSTAVLYLGIRVSSRLNLWPDAATLETLREWADKVQYTVSLADWIGDIFSEIMGECEYPAVGFELLRASGLRYRHFRFILNLDKELREDRWNDAISGLDEVVQVSRSLNSPVEAALLARWIVLLQPLVEGARYVSMGDAVKDCSRRYPGRLDILRSRLALPEAIIDPLIRGMGLLTIIKRNTSEAASRQTTVFRIVSTGTPVEGSGNTHEISNDSVSEAKVTAGMFPTVLLNSKVENKLRRLAPLSMELTRILVQIGNRSLVYDEEFFRELELEPELPLVLESSKSTLTEDL